MRNQSSYFMFFYKKIVENSSAFFATIGIVCLLAIYPTSLDAQGWYPDPGENIAPSANPQQNPDLAMNAAGTIGVAIWKEGTQTINVSFLDTATNTWGTTETLSNTMTPTTVDSPKIAMNAAGDLAIAIWIENNEIHSKRYTGTWSSVSVLGSAPLSASTSLAMNATNNKAIAGWGTATQAITSIYDGTSSWSTAFPHPGTGTTVNETSVSMSSDGTHAAFAYRQNNAGAKTYADICTDVTGMGGQGTWSGRFQLSPIGQAGFSPSISMNSNGSLTRAAWTKNDGMGMQGVESRLCTGTSWAIPDLSAFDDTFNPKIILSGDGTKAILVYLSNSAIPSTVTSKIWTGTWGMAIPISTTDTALATTFTGTADLSKACACWINKPGAPNDRAATVSFYDIGTGGWQSPAQQTTIGDLTLQADTPAIATNSTGDKLIAVWRTGTTPTNQVQWSRFGLAPTPPPPPPPPPSPTPAPTPTSLMTGSQVQLGSVALYAALIWEIPSSLFDANGNTLITRIIINRAPVTNRPNNPKPVKLLAITNPKSPPTTYNDYYLPKNTPFHYIVQAVVPGMPNVVLLDTVITTGS